MSYSKKIASSFLSLMLIFGFILAPISQTLEVKRVEALTVFDPTNFTANLKTSIESTISAAENIAQTVFSGNLSLKETVLDGIAWQLINIVIQEMIRSVTAWVNSGFQGKPAFVTDLNGFLTDIADKYAGNYIYGSNLQFLCSPFKLNIQLALDIQYRKSKGGYRAECRLSDVIGDMDAFLNGDFNAGGWDGWFAMTQTPSNNPYGALLEAETGLYLGVQNVQGQEMKLVDYGRGFLTMKQCTVSDTFDDTDAAANAQEVCTNVTPGSVIETQLNTALSSPTHRLEVADEINELVGAVLSQLTSQIFSGVGGLLGLTNSNYGAGNYFDQAADAANINYNLAPDALSLAITNETRYLRDQQQIVTMLTDAEEYKNKVYGKRDRCSEGLLTISLSNKLYDAKIEVADTAEIVADLTEFRTDLAALQSGTTSTMVISNLRIKYDATSIPEAESNLMNAYMTYQTTGALHTSGELIQLEMVTIPDLKKEIDKFENSIDISCRF